MLKHFLVTKYDPARRDKNRAYLDADKEWSEACDIGKEFDGKVFTLEEYLTTEENYLKTIMAFFDASGLPHLRMTTPPNESLNQPAHMENFRKRYTGLYDPIFEDIQFENDRKICRDELKTLIKMNLRDAGACSLAIDRKFYLYFGWDFYVYVECEAAPKLADLTPPIYVEEMVEQSPYMPRGKIEVLVDKCEIGNDLVAEADLPIFAHVSRNQIRNALGYSDELSFVTHTEITPEMAVKLRQFTNYDFDFKSFEYFLNTYGNDY